ncbi:MAG: 3,4-dihydroxy-2-butanone-4-phosphate synthase [Proteobacteria bacterium]|nr:3,4-dihydroxy-2-butanone-4-phosphate synthase [Pseudomonadota bacterium]
MAERATERVHRALEAMREGRMVVLVDDEDRENEGDLCMAADLVTPEAVNFMARYGRGLICLALTQERVRELRLPMMVGPNPTRRATAFTISIEASRGVSTGISAADRARTIAVAVADDTVPSDLESPGHVFPLRAAAGGVLQRTGHTEGSVDLARLAGRKPASVICEIMSDDGSMARAPQLRHFAREHGLCLLTIADLIQYRLRTESLVRPIAETRLALPPNGTLWSARVYEAVHQPQQFLALTLGNVDASPTLVRVHTGSVLGDIFEAQIGLRSPARHALARIEQDGRGVLLFVPSRWDLADELRRAQGAAEPTGDGWNSPERVLREVGLGAQVLIDLGLRKLRVLTNRPSRLAAIEGFDLEVVDNVPIRQEAGTGNGAELGHVQH